jgi:hypothetical protein
MVSALFAAKHPGWHTQSVTDLGASLSKFAATSSRRNSISKGKHYQAMTQPTGKPSPSQPRCAHFFPASGRQCRLFAADQQSGLCAHHLAKKKVREKDADFFFPLMKQENRFQNAQAINTSLNHLYDLLARDRISARRASTLAYISSLLLRTLPAIDSDSAKGIVDKCEGEFPESAPTPGPTNKPS